MGDSIFIEAEFVGLAFFSFIFPIGLYSYMMWKKSISRYTVLAFGALLITIAGVNVVLLQQLAERAKATASLLDDRLFSSEISLALYLIPALFAGIGTNMISHVLIGHLADAERRFDQERKRG